MGTLTGKLRFGVCTDVHKDIMHDADARLRVFVERMNQEHVDFILQLGDFCRPYEYNRSFMNVWESFVGPRYHVLGNHDTDGGFTRDYVLGYWSMPARYYSFDVGGWHFVVLDGNDERQGRPPGYPRFTAPDQLAWLERDLQATDRPTIICSHQSLADLDPPQEGLENSAAVRTILHGANRCQPKVVACLSGHNHLDAHTFAGGIHYLQINSMSNYWMGEDYLQVRYSEAIDWEYPWIKYTAPYRDPIYALITLDPGAGMRVEGVESAFVGPSPWDLNYPHGHLTDRLIPQIRNRRLGFGSSYPDRGAISD